MNASSITDRGARLLGSAIVFQAAEDYRDLRRRGVEERNTRDNGKYSYVEIEKFLKSDWCNIILRGIGSRFRGDTILRNLRQE